MVKDKIDKQKIMDYFGFSNSNQLKVAYNNALVQTADAPEIEGGRGVKTDKTIFGTVTVGKRGSIAIPKRLIAELGFQEGDGFRIRKTKVGLSLSKK